MDLWEDEGFEYLCDSGTEFEGLKIWGTPWSLWFHGINPHCKAFTGNESRLEKAYNEIPTTTDILISHGPPHLILDSVNDYHTGNIRDCGSFALRHCIEVIKPKICIFGHIHEHGGKHISLKHHDAIKTHTDCYNVSIMNEHYEPVNKPTRIIL